MRKKPGSTHSSSTRIFWPKKGDSASTSIVFTWPWLVKGKLEIALVSSIPGRDGSFSNAALESATARLVDELRAFSPLAQRTATPNTN